MLLTLAILSTSVFVPSSHHTEDEKPPMEQCAYQQKVDSGLWKCYTQSQWDQKVIKEENDLALSIQKSNEYWSSPKGQYQKITNYLSLSIFVIIFFLLAMASVGVEGSAAISIVVSLVIWVVLSLINLLIY